MLLFIDRRPTFHPEKKFTTCLKSIVLGCTFTNTIKPVNQQEDGHRRHCLTCFELRKEKKNYQRVIRSPDRVFLGGLGIFIFTTMSTRRESKLIFRLRTILTRILQNKFKMNRGQDQLIIIDENLSNSHFSKYCLNMKFFFNIKLYVK